MYKDTDLSVLVAREISMVCISESFVRYFLSEDRPKPDLWLEIESSDVAVSGHKFLTLNQMLMSYVL